MTPSKEQRQNDRDFKLVSGDGFNRQVYPQYVPNVIRLCKYSRDELLCFATRKINAKITLSWAHKNFTLHPMY